MLMREGLYPDNSVPQGQILRLSRYRAARIGVDVKPAHRRWTSSRRSVLYGGWRLDREPPKASGGCSVKPVAERSLYITGKWQIMRLLGRIATAKAPTSASAHSRPVDQLGTLPLSVIEWLIFDDESSLREALKVAPQFGE